MGQDQMTGIDLWTAGTAGYHTYRIPALVVTTAGTVLAFCEGRRDGGGDTGQIDLLVRRSRDHGRTWDDARVITSVDGYTRGNPAPVVDRASGDVVLLFTQNGAEHDETDVCAGAGERTVWVTRSTDDGVGWSEPVEITSDVKDPSWTWYATGPCHGVQLRSGRLVVPCDHAVGVKHDRWRDPFRSHVVFSDDGGVTWSLGGVLPDGTNESAVAELADGRLYINVRNHAGKGLRGYAYSADGGQTFARFGWHPQLVEPACQGSVVAGPDGTLYFANPASTARCRLTIRTSGDNGRSWSQGTVVTGGPAAYSDLALTGDGHLLCFHERGDERPYESLRLARIAVGDLEPAPAGEVTARV